MEEMNELVWTNEEWNEMMKKIVEVLNVACDGTDGAGGMHEKVLTDEQIVSFAKKISVGDLDLLFSVLGEEQTKRLSEIIVNGMVGDGTI